MIPSSAAAVENPLPSAAPDPLAGHHPLAGHQDLPQYYAEVEDDLLWVTDESNELY